jgi:hypothetical protein
MGTPWQFGWDQEMVPPLIMKANPVVDFLCSRSPPQSASQYLGFPWMVLHRIVIVTYLINIERLV